MVRKARKGAWIGAFLPKMEYGMAEGKVLVRKARKEAWIGSFLPKME